MAMDRVKLIKKIKEFLKKEGALVKEVSKYDTEVFEAYCFASIGLFYKQRGYTLKPAQISGVYFTFQYSTKSYPWNHSYLEVYDGATLVYEIRHNQSVAGHWAYHKSKSYDLKVVEDFVPQYQADIAVIKPGLLPSTKPIKNLHLAKCVANDDVITFAEVKRLKATPMLLASFQGIVYMIKPHFVNKWYSYHKYKMKSEKYPFPALFTIGDFSPNVQNIYNTMMNSQYAHISIVPNVLDYCLMDVEKKLFCES